MSPCPFCSSSIEPSRFLVPPNDLAMVLYDSYPVSTGHSLIIPRKHVASLFDLSAAEQGQLWAVVAVAREILSEKFHPDGFNIGLNDGGAAGQTVPHAHIHIIPRYNGDVVDPRGGVRWVIREKAAYWDK